jgi:uncharacterized protein (DUF1778 family)
VPSSHDDSQVNKPLSQQFSPGPGLGEHTGLPWNRFAGDGHQPNRPKQAGGQGFQFRPGFSARAWDIDTRAALSRQRCERIDKLVSKWHHDAVENVIETSRKRITARVPCSVHEILEHAANLLGATVNQFVLQTALQEAQRVIDRETVVHLTQKDAHLILSLLDTPPQPKRWLQEAVKLYRKTVRA